MIALVAFMNLVGSLSRLLDMDWRVLSLAGVCVDGRVGSGLTTSWRGLVFMSLLLFRNASSHQSTVARLGKSINVLFCLVH